MQLKAGVEFENSTHPTFSEKGIMLIYSNEGIQNRKIEK